MSQVFNTSGTMQNAMSSIGGGIGNIENEGGSTYQGKTKNGMVHAF